MKFLIDNLVSISVGISTKQNTNEDDILLIYELYLQQML